jgi:predicted nicotinamide N-methyase
MTIVLPASQTKHLAVLTHPIPRNPTIVLELQQITSAPSIPGRAANTGTGTTGTTLWSSSQVIAAYLSSLAGITSPDTTKSHRVLELGSGVGYISLCLASWGWNVTASDIEPVLSTVLAPNIKKNIAKVYGGSVRPIAIDWTMELPEELTGEYDMIITADTIYHPPLVLPLFNTIKKICQAQKSQPIIYIGLERRDSRLVDGALEAGREVGFEITRVGRGRVQKALDRAGWSQVRKAIKVDQADEDGEDESFGEESEDWGWDGVEIWKARWRGPAP